MQSFSADVSRLWTMTYWYLSVDAAQVTVITRPTVTPTWTDPHTGYEFLSNATPTTGDVLGNPTWKLFKPFTTTGHTSVIVISVNILIEELYIYSDWTPVCPSFVLTTLNWLTKYMPLVIKSVPCTSVPNVVQIHPQWVIYYPLSLCSWPTNHHYIILKT